MNSRQKIRAESQESPWHEIACRGKLEPDESEWIHSNGLGSYAMSTLALMHTRRYHGVLVAALNPPQGRHVILSHAELSLRVGKRTYRLATHQFPNLAPTPGFRRLERFEQSPLPTWTYRTDEGRLRVRLCLARRHNTAVFEFKWSGDAPAIAVVRPLMPLRSTHELTHEHGAMMQVATLRPGEVSIKPVARLPAIVFRHHGVFIGSPDWWRQLEYLLDRDRAAAFREDLWTPGMFEFALEPSQSGWLSVSVGEAPPESAEAMQKEAAEYLLATDPGSSRRAAVRALHVAAASFCATEAPSPAIIAGFPWFDVHWRDAMISLPGLLLVRGRIDEAKAVLNSAFRSLRGGLLPMVADKVGRERAKPSPDATLWMFEAVGELIRRVGVEDPFVTLRCFPTLVRAFVGIQRGPHRCVGLTDDWLVASYDRQHALTWMDSGISPRPTVIRRGAPIEWQALWLNGVETLGRLALALGHDGLADLAASVGGRGEAAFKMRFWCRDTGFACDCVSEDSSGDDVWCDRSVRPNAVLALALRPSLFEPWQATAILDRARLDLVTRRGLRTLSPSDGRYHGYHEGGHEEREASAHQGTSWPFLLASFVRACRERSPEDTALADELTRLVESCISDGLVLGQVSQMADGDAPHRLRGCPAQAFSAAELLRALADHLGH